MAKGHLDKLDGQKGKGLFKDKLKSYLVRCNAETPPFFKKLRTVGVIVVAAGTAVITAPVALPAAVLAIGGYLIVGGAVASAVSQAAIADAHMDCPSKGARGTDDDHFQPLAN
jgi:hypothetical protein